MSDLAKIFDVFFNGRSAETAAPSGKSQVTIDSLIKRGTSVILVKGKLYRVTVEPATVVAK